MKREDYENFKWYKVTNETYWVEDYPDEFPGCQTIVCSENKLYTQMASYLGWGTMAKCGDWYFMIIKKKEEP